MPRHHLFLSYSRRDNDPGHQGRDGWVTAFHRRLLAQHKRYSGRELKVFFDRESIDHGADWQRGIYGGLRNSSLFIAFLSANYLRSEWCRREWEEYLRLEHTLARGDGGILPIYFEIIPAGNPSADDARLQQELAEWIGEIRRRHRGEAFELVPWFAGGPDVLRELDAAERLAELRENPQSDARQLVRLAGRVDAMDRAIAHRLDKATLAELAPGNLDASYSHFVGRHRELRELHATLIADRIGLVGALHGLGGQGKTALAIQYAYAYAEHYAAGGRWFLPCEGKTNLAEALEPLASLIGLTLPKPPDTLPPGETNAFVLKSLLAALEQWTRQRVGGVQTQLSQQANLHTGQDLNNRPRVEPHCLLILDNVSHPDLLSAGGLARLVREDWLQVVATTRLDPHEFGGDAASLTPIAVDDLPEPDALALIREFQPLRVAAGNLLPDQATAEQRARACRRFANPGEEAAALEIVRELGGFTLAVELVGAWLQAHAREGATCAGYLAWLRQNGVVSTDTHGADPATARRVRYGEETPAETEARKRRRKLQVALIVEDAMRGLSPAARHVLELASLLPPDLIVIDWLRAAATGAYPELSAENSAPINPWLTLLHELLGRRLLVVTEYDPNRGHLPRQARLHRLVGEHLLDKLAVDDHARRLEALIEVIHDVQAQFEHTYRHDSSARWQLRPLEETIRRLWREVPGRRELAMAAGVAGTAEFETGQIVRAESLLQLFHETLEAQHKREPTNQEHARLYAIALNLIGNFLSRRARSGDAEKALDHYHRSLEIDECLLLANPESTQAARDVSVSLERLGDFLDGRGLPGDAEQALGHYQRSLEVSERLLSANPDSAQAERDVSVSLNKLGDFLARRGQPGDAEQALLHYQRGLEVSERLLSANPDSAEAARDVSVSLNKLADFLALRGQPGDAEQALGHYQRSLEISERLLSANPDSAQAARDVSVSLNNLADFLALRGLPGDAEQALGHYQRCHEVLERLLSANPDSALAARDVSVGLNKLADFLALRGLPGDAEQAFGHYQRSLEVRERLLSANPDSAQAARDVFNVQFRLADFLMTRGQSGDGERALRLMGNCLSTCERLLSANPDSAQAARDVSVSLERLGDFLASRGQPGDAEQALGHYQRSLEVRERLLSANPDSAQAERDVMVSIERLSKMRAGQGDAPGALVEQERALEIARQLWERAHSYEMGRSLAISSLLTGQYAVAVGDQGKAAQHLGECFSLLDGFVRQGAQLDAQMRQLHGQLKGMFSP